MNKTVQNIIEQVTNNGSISFVPGGNSMWPTLKDKKQPVIIQKKLGDLRLYDVILYHRNGEILVLHRIVGFSGDGYICCGDNTVERETVAPYQIIGVMVGFYRGKKFISDEDTNYIIAVKKHFADEKKRRARLKRFARIQAIKRKLKGLFSK